MIDWGSENTPPFVTLHYKDKDVHLSLQEDGSYVDADGTVYPAMLFDPGYAGISPLETGTGDPFWKIAAAPHDKAFNQMLAGYNDSERDNLKTFGTFVQNIGLGMLSGTYMLLAGIPYILVGGVGGMLRWSYLTSTKK